MESKYTYSFFISIFLDFEKIQGRGPLASGLAVILKKIKIAKYVIYDGRAASYEEAREYQMTNDNNMFCRSLYKAEKLSITKSDYCIAVSSALVDYWRSEFNFNGNFKVEPCRPTAVKYKNFSKDELYKLRSESLFNHEDVVIVFAGGNGPWQSYDLIYQFF